MMGFSISNWQYHYSHEFTCFVVVTTMQQTNAKLCSQTFACEFFRFLGGNA